MEKQPTFDDTELINELKKFRSDFSTKIDHSIDEYQEQKESMYDSCCSEGKPKDTIQYVKNIGDDPVEMDFIECIMKELKEYCDDSIKKLEDLVRSKINMMNTFYNQET